MSCGIQNMKVVLLLLLTDGSVNEDVVITKPYGDGSMTCREIRRNSAGCLKFRDECQKCKEIEHVGESVLAWNDDDLTPIKNIQNNEN